MVEHSAQRRQCRARRHAPLGPPRPRPRQEGARLAPLRKQSLVTARGHKENPNKNNQVASRKALSL